ncbi:MAG: polyprenyl synthetase family protein [Planctomycetota bacterium]|jgi:geranylgeranyl diphosphate synthase type II
MKPELKSALETLRSRVDGELERLLPPEATPPSALHEAMRYAVLSPGKRLRPILCLLACEAVEGPIETAMRPACALEMIHAYSLVHDDLPAMDDAALRRGRPTLHKKFGEAPAILSGDALLTLAFEVASLDGAGERTGSIVRELARAAGSLGMVGGQTLDLENEGKSVDETGLERIHRLKTGALIRASVVMGGLAGGADEAQLEALSEYGRCAGLAFQVADDLLDVESSPEILGKDTGADAEAGKATYPALLGVENARKKARALARGAGEAAGRLPRGEPLADLALYIVERKR